MFGIKKKGKNFAGKRIFSIEDYLSIEKNLPETYEFWNEFVIKLDEPDFFPDSIQKLETEIDKKLADTPYKVFSNFFCKSKKVWIESENCLLYPDLFVVNAEDIKHYQNREDIICNPLMIIEVSTIYSMEMKRDQTFLRDRKEKLWMYQKIASLQEYVLIADNGVETVVETYNRLEANCWKYQSFTKKNDQSVTFESIDLKLPITDLYI